MRYEDMTSVGYDIKRNLDRNEHFFSMGFLSQGSSRAMFFVSGEYGKTAFSQAFSTFKNTESYAAYAGVEFLPGTENDPTLSRFTGRINIGYNWFNLIDPTQRDYRGLTCNTNVSYSLSRRTSLLASLTRGPRFSAFSNMAFFIQNAFGAGISHSFSRQLSLSYNVAYGTNAYQAAGDGENMDPVKNLNQTVRMGIQLRENLSLTLLSIFSNRRAWFTERVDNSRFFIGIEFIYGFPGLEPTVPLILNTR